MKRRFLLLAVLLSGLMLPAAAMDFGIETSAGAEGMIKLYTFENIAFKMNFESNFSFDIGCRFTENILKTSREPAIYFAPGINLYYYNYYLGGGAFLAANQQPSFFLRTGGVFGDWDWGPGKGNMIIGAVFSPTIYAPDTGDAASDAIGGIIGTIFNIVKLEVGVSWYLPF